MPELSIRPERPEDRPEVQALITAAFRRAGSDGPVVETVLNDQLRRDPAWRADLTLVAESDGMVVGQLTCSDGTIESIGDPGSRTTVVAIGPVAVRPDHQGQGIGRALVRKVIAMAGESGEQLLVLLGSPDFYGRFGFRPAAAIGVESPDPAWGKYFQAMPLSAEASPPTGRFRYARPFEDL